MCSTEYSLSYPPCLVVGAGSFNSLSHNPVGSGTPLFVHKPLGFWTHPTNISYPDSHTCQPGETVTGHENCQQVSRPPSPLSSVQAAGLGHNGM